MFTVPFDLSGQPAISIPAGLTAGEDAAVPRGLPIGAQLVAGLGREDLLLQIASQVEQEREKVGQRPPVFA